MIDSRLRALMDRTEISDVIGRYCYGMDSRDWTAVRSCWTAEMSNSFLATASAPEGTTIRADDFVDMLRGIFEDIPHTQHIKIPVSFQFDADRTRARVIASMQVKHWGPNRHGEMLLTTVGYYDDVFVRTPEGWRMTQVTQRVHWQEGNAEVLSRGERRGLNLLRQRYPQVDWENGIRPAMTGEDSDRTIHD